jgi:DNA-binding MarR family transcriptional regulator
MKLDDCVSFQLARASRALHRSYKDRLYRYDFTPPQLFLLLALYERDDVAAGELAARIHVDKSTLTGILIRLEKRGLITRENDEDDGRSVRVSLTEKGRKLRRPLTAIYEDVNGRAIQSLGTHGPALRTLLNTLEQVASD